MTAAFAVAPRDTILSLELSWMGGGSVRGGNAATLSVELQRKQYSDLCTDQSRDNADIEQEYQELVSLPVPEVEPEACSATSSVLDASAALRKKEQECEHLRQIIKELVESRAKIAKTNAEVQQRYCALQAEFYKARKVSELARTVAQQHMRRHTQVRREVQDARLRAYRAEQAGATLRQQNADLREERESFKRKVDALENLHSWESPHPGTCFQNFPFTRQVALY